MSANIKIRVTAKRCKCCGELKAMAEFHKDPRRADGRKSECKPCMHAQVLRNWHRRTSAQRAKWAEIARQNAAEVGP